MHEYVERMVENELIQESLTLRERESFLPIKLTLLYSARSILNFKGLE